MIKVNVNIYFDALQLLKDTGIDISNEVCKVLDNTDFYNNFISDKLNEKYKDFLSLYEQSNLILTDYLLINENEVYFDYYESRKVDSPRMIPFYVICNFDDERYMNDLREEYEESLEKEN